MASAAFAALTLVTQAALPAGYARSDDYAELPQAEDDGAHPVASIVSGGKGFRHEEKKARDMSEVENQQKDFGTED